MLKKDLEKLVVEQAEMIKKLEEKLTPKKVEVKEVVGYNTVSDELNSKFMNMLVKSAGKELNRKVKFKDLIEFSNKISIETGTKVLAKDLLHTAVQKGLIRYESKRGEREYGLSKVAKERVLAYRAKALSDENCSK